MPAKKGSSKKVTGKENTGVVENKRNAGGSGKATNAEMLSRVNETNNLLIDGYSRSGILQYFTNEKNIDISIYTIDKYIEKAGKLFAAEANVNRTQQIGKINRRYQKLYKVAYELKDVKAACKVLEGERALFGYDEPSRIRHSGNIGNRPHYDLDKLSVEQLEQLEAILECADK